MSHRSCGKTKFQRLSRPESMMIALNGPFLTENQAAGGPGVSPADGVFLCVTVCASSGHPPSLQDHANPQRFIAWFPLIGCVEATQAKFPLSRLVQRVLGLLQQVDLLQLTLHFHLSLSRIVKKNLFFFETDSWSQKRKSGSARKTGSCTHFLSLSKVHLLKMP